MNEEIKKLIEEFEISAEFKFVPFSKSRHCVDRSKKWYEKPNWGSLNWSVTLMVKGSPILTTDYAKGIAHVPGYSHTNRMTVHEDCVLFAAIESGSVPLHRPPRVARIGNIPEPSIDEVLYSLLLDGSPDFDATSFEEWCGNYGYEEDSGEALKLYEDCSKIGRKIRGALGPEAVEQLREAFQDY